MWRLAYRADRQGRVLADRHYNRQSLGSAQFVPPGGCAVFVTTDARAVWVTSTPFAEYVKHAWAGAWVNSLFRNEGSGLSSDLIRQAVAASLAIIGEPVPPLGIVTFVDAAKVRRKRDRCGVSDRILNAARKLVACVQKERAIKVKIDWHACEGYSPGEVDEIGRVTYPGREPCCFRKDESNEDTGILRREEWCSVCERNWTLRGEWARERQRRPNFIRTLINAVEAEERGGAG